MDIRPIKTDADYERALAEKDIVTKAGLTTAKQRRPFAPTVIQSSSMVTTTSPVTSWSLALLTCEKCLRLWLRDKEMWRHRTPDPIEEPEKMRRVLGTRRFARTVTRG
jgi:hypothetical protein